MRVESDMEVEQCNVVAPLRLIANRTRFRMVQVRFVDIDQGVVRRNCRVILLHDGDRLWPDLPETLGNAAARSFGRRGLEVRLMIRVVAVDADGATLQDGKRIMGGTVICTIGSVPQPLAAAIDVPKERGRFVTKADLSVQDRVWAAGDCALVPNRHDGSYCPPTAQFAERQAEVLAENLLATINGKPTREFRYRPKGQLASIGHTKAVAWIYGIRLSGFVAWLLWRALYLVKIPTLARKVRLYLEWSWAMFFPPDISHLSFARTTDRDASTQGAMVSGDNRTQKLTDDAADRL